MRAKIRNHIWTASLVGLCLFSLLGLDWFRSAGFHDIAGASKPATLDTASSSSLLEKSSHVIVGSVLDVESRWDEKAVIIFTYVKMHVEELLKGELTEDYVTIHYRGGKIGSIGLVVSDEPRFHVGEKVKVFLRREETGYFSVVDGVDGKISLAASASSGYDYSGIRWADADLPVPYYINQDGTPDIAGTVSEFDAVRASFQTWEDDSGSSMDYTYMGTTTRSDQIDGYNAVLWRSIDGPGGTLAETFYWYNPATQEMIEFDIVFDEDETWSATGELDKFDIQNVGTHEVGHTLVLTDLTDAADSEETMYAYCTTGETKKRTLAAGDITGIRYIYPVAAPPPATITITTNPSGLQIEVDGVNYTAPQSFAWAPGTIHTIDVSSPQTGGVGIRYVFSGWSDGGSQQHTFTVGSLGVTISASFITQYLETLALQELDLAFPATVTFTRAGQSKNTFTADSWSDWCDAGSVVTVSKNVNGEEGERWLTRDVTSWTVDSPFSATVRYFLQYRISMRFATDDLAVTLKPTSVRIFGSAPNSSLLMLTSYTNLWLDNVGWTLERIMWQDSNVVPANGTSVNLTRDYQWTVVCQVYATSFRSAFRNSKGLELSEPPSAFTLLFPNGTVSRGLDPSDIYYIQNGTTTWQSIIWQDAEVAPSNVSFDASLGNPTVNCRIYDFSIRVSDVLGFPVNGAYVSVEFQNGRTRTAQTGSDGVALIRMAPAGEFTVQASFLTQRIAVAGDVAEAASAPVEVEMLWGLSSLVLFLSVCAIVAFVSVFVFWKTLGRRQRVAVSPQ